MSVDISELLPALQASLNVPGESFFKFDGLDDEWTEALANAFWWAHLRGFFKEYRVDPDSFEIINTTGGADLSRELQQVIVIFAAMVAIETKLISLPTSATDKAGPVETERQRSAGLLRALLADRRADLESIRYQIVFGGGITSVAVIDAVLARGTRVPTDPIGRPQPDTGVAWVR